MIKFVTVAAAAAIALAAQASAQAPAPVPAPTAPQANLRGNWLQADQTRQQAQQRADMMFQRLDANHDGTLTKAEADAAAAISCCVNWPFSLVPPLAPPTGKGCWSVSGGTSE
jgi:hypothetical protein